MFDYQMTPNTERSHSALEIALQARIHEREMALMAGEFKSQNAKRGNKATHFLQVLFASLFLG
ncbi:MAG: hypothetical protein IH586_02765 [Anaerolineaceae bacterium]|nr:hypothetical protein [Anaerolineaceae bacterium]